jgi:dolichol-phosphate mannosyltransferase
MLPDGPLLVSAQPVIESDASHGLQTLFLSLIIPTYNESQNISKLLKVVSELLDPHFAHQYELIVVDDDSPDLTWQYAYDLGTIYPQIRVVRRQGERGLSSAVVRGWQVARGEILGVIDADLQHPPEILLKLLASMAAGADLAIASRHIEGGGVSDWSFARRFLSRGAQVLGLLILPQVVGRVTDPMSGFFMVRRSAIADIPLKPRGYKILLEVLGRGRITEIAEIGYVFQERAEGSSKVTRRQYLDYLFHLVQLRFRHPKYKQPFLLQWPLDRFIRFGLVGLSGVWVDMVVFYLLSDPSTLAWGLTRSKLIAAETAIVNNFIWNDSWTFQDLSKGQSSGSSRLKRFLKFNLICVAGLLINVVILNVLFNQLGCNRYLANVISILAVSFWNFGLSLKLNWRVTDGNSSIKNLH